MQEEYFNDICDIRYAEIGPNCNYSVFDMTNIHNISSFVDKIFLDYKTIDAVICNAGISLHEDNILDVTIDNFEKQLQTNLEGNQPRIYLQMNCLQVDFLLRKKLQRLLHLF